MGAEPPRSDSARGAAALVLAATLLGGCATAGVLIEIDLSSFMDAAARAAVTYRVPSGTTGAEPLAIEPQVVALPEGLAGLLRVDDVELELGLDVDNLGNACTVRVQLYLAPADDGATYVYATTPVLDVTRTLAATERRSLQLASGTDDDGRLPALFAGGALAIGLAVTVDASATPGGSARGSWRLEVLRATVRGHQALSP